MNKAISRSSQLGGQGWMDGHGQEVSLVTPSSAPWEKNPLQTLGWSSQECLPRGKRLPRIWCLPMVCPQRTLRRPQPIMLSLRLQARFSSASPVGRTSASSPQAGGMGFWMGRVKFQLDPAAPVPLLPSTCSLGGAWLAPPMTADDSNIL